MAIKGTKKTQLDEVVVMEGYSVLHPVVAGARVGWYGHQRVWCDEGISYEAEGKLRSRRHWYLVELEAGRGLILNSYARVVGEARECRDAEHADGCDENEAISENDVAGRYKTQRISCEEERSKLLELTAGRKLLAEALTEEDDVHYSRI